ncbi:MAG TPA: pseudouridine synthase, partial [Kofleriaceae bacterium]|nr:pseudouridine synthase [Kofleriaceae bacterium]
MAEPVRLQRYLAAAGVAARRKAEELITAGRVTVNGAVVNVLGTRIDPEHDAVEVDGEAVVALDQFYVLFNKPKGCITAVTDDRGRPTVMDYLLNLPVPVKPVGRLDFYSEGVLLLTNDGELAARLLAPASHVPKTYHVKVHGQLERAELVALRSGVTLEDGTTTLPAEIEILPGESKHTWLGVTIHEGKHRQIHRMIEALGHRVDKLQRVAFANLTFHELRVGDARELTQQELNELRDSVGLDHTAVARGRWHSQREATDIPRRARARARAEEEAAASGAPPDKEHPSTGAGAAVSRGAPEASTRRAPDARQSPVTPTGRRAEHGQRLAHGEGPGDRKGRGHGEPPGERGAGDRRAAYGPAASERGVRRPADGPAASERGARRAAYGPAASERGVRRPADGPAASERGARR